MIAPLAPLSLKGVIWYQGEANCGRAKQYRSLLTAMIHDWRDAFGQDDLPFLIVSLANFHARPIQPGESQWAELREAQAMAAQSIEHSGLAVAIDIGEAGDIHPKNKQEIGRRLALAAHGVAYKTSVNWSGPSYRDMAVDGSTIRITFDHADGLATSDGRILTGFAIAGTDHTFTWAQARIDGSTVIVSAPTVAQPVAVRYAWADNPDCNLVNATGLPAVPFRTDQLTVP